MIALFILDHFAMAWFRAWLPFADRAAVLMWERT